MGARILFGLVGAAVWVWGLMMFVDGDQAIGGAVVLAGGALIVLALRGGWDRWWDAVTSWLYWR